MKRNLRHGYTLIELLAVLVMMAFLASVLWPVFDKAQTTSQRISCLSNTKRIGDAMRQYAADYDQHLPPLAINDVTSSVPPFSQPYGWADAIQLYLGNTAILHCPSETSRTSVDGVQNGFTDYWMNANLSAAPLQNLVSPSYTILLGEGNDGSERTNARYNLRALPEDWRAYLVDADNPSKRHSGVANYLFADGHVKMMPTEQVASFKFLPPRQKEPIP